MNLLLTDEEIAAIMAQGTMVHDGLGTPHFCRSINKDIARAQLKKIRESEEYRYGLRQIIVKDRNLAYIQLGECEPLIYYKSDTQSTVDKILALLEE